VRREKGTRRGGRLKEEVEMWEGVGQREEVKESRQWREQWGKRKRSRKRMKKRSVHLGKRKKRKGTDMIENRAEKGMKMINLPKEVLSSRASSTPLWEFPGSSSLYAAF